MENKIIPVVFSTDDNYVIPLCVAIQSIKNTLEQGVTAKIFIFNSGLKEENKQTIKSLASDNICIEFVDITKYLDGFNMYVGGSITVATYYRFFAPLVLKNYPKIIYLDCDLILNRSISQLYDLDLEDNILIGVQDYINYNGYINAGVLCINVKKFLEENVCEKCIDYINANRNLKYFDQDALNYVCKGKIKLVSQKYNFRTKSDWKVKDVKNSFKAFEIPGIKDVVVIHYAALRKPWINVNCPLKHLWKKVAKTLPANIYGELKYYCKTVKRPWDIQVLESKKLTSRLKNFFQKVKCKLNKNK